eukprot:TRINITY_DN47067_c0_g1_i1.p2 TRINITY_DN47067_c0_g1~~TRINITY_DN47067_c0_g1_i1.p2  ORF type:complete len:145 (-),score=14.47 TRINITY_DN47067_c0_g1_i1:170-604(-)
MFKPEAIFIPMAAQVAVTAVVWCYMFYTRIAEVQRLGIKQQQFKCHVEFQLLVKNVAGPSDNLVNLLEMPTLFYAAVLTLYVTRWTNDTYLFLSCVYVVLRALHSFVHCTFNHLMTRFAAYLVSTLVLYGIWAGITYNALANAF